MALAVGPRGAGVEHLGRLGLQVGHHVLKGLHQLLLDIHREEARLGVVKVKREGRIFSKLYFQKCILLNNKRIGRVLKMWKRGRKVFFY